MSKSRRSGILVGTAGVYFVASQLAAKGFHAAPTFGNAPNVDILAGLPDGAATVSLQVKTTWNALRKRGRGQEKKPHHYEWDVGERSARLNKPDLFFAFVDLKGTREMPDVYIVPSEVIHGTLKRLLEMDKKVRVRWHPKIDTAEKYKNRWDILFDYLKDRSNL